MNNVKITGIGKAVPAKVITNEDLSSIVDTSHEWIHTRTGIDERRISEGQNTSDLATEAAEKAMKDAGVSPEEIDLILVATITPDSFMPSTACIVQQRIKAKNAAAMDISAACSGFVYGINTATNYLMTGMYKTILVIGAEVMSKVINWEDRRTCVLFGDGAGAVILQQSKECGILAMDQGANGTMRHALICNAPPVKNFLIPSPEEINYFVEMDGGEVFKFAVRIIVESVKKLANKVNIEVSSIDHIVVHQANYRIIELAAKMLKVSTDTFFMNLSKYGNTSSASIPLALEEMKEKNMLKPEDKIIFVGFGGGLTWASTLLKW